MTTDREALNKIFEAALKQPDPIPSPRMAGRSPYSSGAATRTLPRNNTAATSSRISAASGVAESPAVHRQLAAPTPDRTIEPLGEAAVPQPVARPPVEPVRIKPADREPTMDRTQTTHELQRLLKDKHYRESGRRKHLVLVIFLTVGVVLSIAGAWFLSSAQRREALFFSPEKIRADADINRYASGKALTLRQPADAEVATSEHQAGPGK